MASAIGSCAATKSFYMRKEGIHMDLMQLGLQLMGYGLLGVFAVLLIFMGSIKLLTVIFPYKEEPEQES